MLSEAKRLIDAHCLFDWKQIASMNTTCLKPALAKRLDTPADVYGCAGGSILGSSKYFPLLPSHRVLYFCTQRGSKVWCGSLNVKEVWYIHCNLNPRPHALVACSTEKQDKSRMRS